MYTAKQRPTAVSRLLDLLQEEIAPCVLPPRCVVERYKARYPRFARAIEAHFELVEDVLTSDLDEDGEDDAT